MPANQQNFNRRDVLRGTGTAAALGTVGLAGCLGDDDDDDSVDMTIAYTAGPESAQTQAVVAEFVDRVEEETDGRISIDMEAGTLGGTEDILDATQGGSVEMVLESPEGTATRFAPEYTFAGDPFVIRDVDHYRNVEEELLLPDDGLNGELTDSGLRMFEGFRWGNRGVTANMPVRTPEDVQGMQMRLPEFDSWVGVWEEIGVNATPVAFDELYSALETGVAEASEGPITQFMDTSLYEVQTHFSDTQHLLSMHHFIMNEDFYQGLADDDKDYLENVMEEAATDITESLFQGEQDDFEAARDEGTEIIEQDEIDREAFVEAGTPYLEELAADEWAVDFETIRSL